MTNLTDQQLLEQFLGGDQSPALEQILKRHGPRVKGVCLRVLENAHDADDAFQAVFLVFTRRAASIRNRWDLRGWFYGVALRCATRLKQRLAIRHERECALREDVMHAQPESASPWEALRPILDEELGALSEKYQVPLVCCYLDGLSPEAAAQETGVEYKTLTTRLARGRDLLRQRLVRRGVTVSGAALGTLILQNASSAAYAMSDAAIQSAVQSVMASGILAGPAATAATGAASATAIEVMKGVLQTMLYQKLIATASVLVLGGILTATSVTVLVNRPPRPPPARETTPSPSKPTAASPSATRPTAAAAPKNPVRPGEDFKLVANRAIKREGWEALREILKAWAEKDLAGFVKWARPLPKQLPEDDVRDDALRRVAWAWAQRGHSVRRLIHFSAKLEGGSVLAARLEWEFCKGSRSAGNDLQFY